MQTTWGARAGYSIGIDPVAGQEDLRGWEWRGAIYGNNAAVIRSPSCRVSQLALFPQAFHRTGVASRSVIWRDGSSYGMCRVVN